MATCSQAGKMDDAQLTTSIVVIALHQNGPMNTDTVRGAMSNIAAEVVIVMLIIGAADQQMKNGRIASGGRMTESGDEVAKPVLCALAKSN